MAKVFNAGDVLAAADLNTNMIQPGTAGTGNRLVAGKTAFTVTSGTTGATPTISYGVTFTTLTSLVATIQSASNVDLVLNYNGAPTTSSAACRIITKDGGTAGSTVNGQVHWVAVGT